jgi:hypothetical protein
VIEFVIKWKRKWFWHKHKVVGFHLTQESNRMALFYKDGSIYEIPKWSECACKLGSDYHQMLKEKMEKEAGTAIR